MLEAKILSADNLVDPLRNSGIPAIGQIPWGTHFCQFYATKDDLLSTLVPYFAAGLEANEFCFWVTTSIITPGEAAAALREAVPCLDRYIASGQIKIIDHTQWYTLGGKFHGKRVLSGWMDLLAQTLHRGYDGMRVSGDMLWLEPHNWHDCAQYEAEVARIIGGTRFLALCTYAIENRGLREAIDIFASHQFALIKDGDTWEIVHNVSREWTEQLFIETYQRYRALFESTKEGFALQEIITDNTGKPCDCLLLDVNPGFERLLKLKRGDVIGKRALELYPALEPEWFEIFGQVVSTGKSAHFEKFAAPLNRWYDIFAYKIAPGRFATLFRDISDRKFEHDALKWRARRNDLLADAATVLLRGTDHPQRAIKELCQKVMAFLGCEVFFNYLADETIGRLKLNAYAGIADEAARAIEWLDYGIAICGTVAKNGTRCVATDILNSSDEKADLVRSYGVQAYCCHPLMHRGRVIGTLSFGTCSRPEFSSCEIEVMQTVAGLVAMAMDRIQTENALRVSEAELAAEANALSRLDDLASQLWGERDLGRGLHAILAAIMELLSADTGTIQLVNPQQNELRVVAQIGLPAAILAVCQNAPSTAYCRQAVSSESRIAIEDIENVENSENLTKSDSSDCLAGFRSVHSTPFFGRNGSVSGVLTMSFRNPRKFLPRESQRLDLYVRKIGDFLERCVMDEALRNSEQRLLAVMEAVPVGISVLDANGASIHSNAAFDKIWGLPRPPVRGLEDFPQYRAWFTETGALLATEDWAAIRAIQHGETVVGQLLRLQNFEGRTVYVSNSAAPIRDARGNITGAAVGVVDITQQTETLEVLRRSQQDLAEAQKVGATGSWRLDLRDNSASWSEETYHILGVPQDTPSSYALFLGCVHPDDRSYVLSRRAAAIEGAPYEAEFRINADGQEKWVKARGVLEFEANGEPATAFGVIQDITDRKHREEQVQTLLREVNHRAKNMLALVQAIAWQTAAVDPEDFVARFSERVQALGASQDLLVQSEWRGVEMEALVRIQLAHFKDLIGERIIIGGVPLRLCAAASQSFGMALHELATNASKYGALSNEEGQVNVSWRFEPAEGSEGHLVFSWTESGGPSVEPPTRRGFGHRVLVTMPQLELDADVQLNYAAMGLNWTLVCPTEKVMDRK